MRGLRARVCWRFRGIAELLSDGSSRFLGCRARGLTSWAGYDVCIVPNSTSTRASVSGPFGAWLGRHSLSEACAFCPLSGSKVESRLVGSSRGVRQRLLNHRLLRQCVCYDGLPAASRKRLACLLMLASRRSKSWPLLRL